jgi:hypothetical protein
MIQGRSMRDNGSSWIRASLAIGVTAWLLAAPTAVAGQDRRGSSTPATAPASPAPASVPAPASTPAPAPAPSSGGSEGHAEGGGRTERGHGAVPAGTAVQRDGGSRATGSTGSGSSGGNGVSGTVAAGRRTSDGQPITGTAVPRGSVPVRTGGGVTIVPVGYGFYPWGYGGLGFGGYYGGYYDPFDPLGGYGGYGGAGGYSGYSSQNGDDGAVRIKVKPREASVYADGYYVGVVDDFDGVFQRLHLSSGPHRIEIRAPQYEPLAFEVRIDRGQTVTYHGEMKKVS